MEKIRARFDKIALGDFRARLEQKRQELAAELSKNGIIIPLERCPDSMDAVRAAMDRALDVGLTAKTAREFKLVCAALKKITHTPNEYGVCENEDCTEKILLKRLQALPWAKYCADCQTALEERQRRRKKI